MLNSSKKLNRGLPEIPQRFNFFEEFNIHLKMAALPGDLFGNLPDHMTHKLWNCIQPVLGSGSPREMALLHLCRSGCHAGFAAHAAHHLVLKLIENVLCNLRVAKLSSLFFG